MEIKINHIKNVQEIVDRLVANNFACDYDQRYKVVTFMSCPRYEESKYELIGYHYVGVPQPYEVILDEIGWSFEELASMVVDEAKKKVAITMQKMLNNNIAFIESGIRDLS